LEHYNSITVRYSKSTVKLQAGACHGQVDKFGLDATFDKHGGGRYTNVLNPTNSIKLGGERNGNSASQTAGAPGTLGTDC
jgi:hypothetical protein